MTINGGNPTMVVLINLVQAIPQTMHGTIVTEWDEDYNDPMVFIDIHEDLW